MTTFTHTVKDSIGIHARPAGKLVSEAKKYKSYITISNGIHAANAKGLFNVTGLGVNCGDTVTVTVSGADEVIAAQNLREYFAANI
ncbi:MAG TPA: HPr family phosphocarrier protein [Candidatus Ornithomonoglobus intestinigallinarum]|uniref:HPr family phosphocarrier protein n=1 Tax=Candidatus Ornithomonoglobus intestinigallinarum TaxID=2840894 RepID=A0A9D1H1D1_9FIRM|nr:HPr family phosphocarrier protein [Candidatus Ornithomonoglobus intestinigallinarum]